MRVMESVYMYQAHRLLFILYSDRFGFKASRYNWAHCVSFVNELAEAIELYYLG